MRAQFHILLHFLVPLGVALAAYRSRWRSAFAIMMATMVIDLDHLLAVPQYDPNRCSIGFHPLHRPLAIVAYVVLAFLPKSRLVGLGLVIHMILDGIDCVWMRGLY